MVGKRIEGNLREGILHIGPVHFLVAAMLAEDELGGEPVAIGIFVVEDDDAFPVTIVDHLQQSLERIVFPFLLFPTLELKKKSPASLTSSTIQSQST